MGLLLDSHILLWWDHELSRLTDAQHDAIGNPVNQVFVSAVSAWELGIKKSSGRLIVAEAILVLTQRFGFCELPVSMRHAERAATLPLLHKDPFDRMLVAQAIVENLVLVSSDRLLANYPGLRLLN